MHFSVLSSKLESLSLCTIWHNCFRNLSLYGKNTETLPPDLFSLQKIIDSSKKGKYNRKIICMYIFVLFFFSRFEPFQISTLLLKNIHTKLTLNSCLPNQFPSPKLYKAAERLNNNHDNTNNKYFCVNGKKRKKRKIITWKKWIIISMQTKQVKNYPEFFASTHKQWTGEFPWYSLKSANRLSYQYVSNSQNVL